MPEFSDYIVFADESGDHGLASIDPQFPVFALVFCVFEKAAYAEQIEPVFRRLKFKYFGHDAASCTSARYVSRSRHSPSCETRQRAKHLWRT